MGLAALEASLKYIRTDPDSSHEFVDLLRQARQTTSTDESLRPFLPYIIRPALEVAYRLAPYCDRVQLVEIGDFLKLAVDMEATLCGVDSPAYLSANNALSVWKMRVENTT